MQRALMATLLFSIVTAAQGQAATVFSDKAVETAIGKGMKYLWSRQQPDGSWHYPKKGHLGGYPVGPSALVAYSLMESGINPQDPRMAKALAWLARQTTSKTYTLGLRANVWLAASRTDRKYIQLLRRDVVQLIKSTRNGSYGYNSAGKRKSVGDNSNSQYGLLGVWAGARADLEIPRQYWTLVLSHWLNSQGANGGWGYTAGRAESHTMTAAGVASLFVCYDNLLSEGFVKCNVNRALEMRPVQKGLDWFDQRFAGSVKGSPNFYYLYGIERVGLASGYKYFGTADWYKLGAMQLLRAQSAQGHWKGGYGTDIDTAFALLFLIRGRHPVLFNKLEFQADWNNRPRDLASLTRWMNGTFETTVNWQIINLRTPVTEWHDAPILYISASKAPTFSDEELENLRKFVWQGGTIFSATECKGKGFREGIRKVYAKLLPDYELAECGDKHDLYSVYFELPGRPKFFEISNGIRPLVIHTDVDLPLSWQMRKVATQKWAFQAAANVFMYITDKGSLRHRGSGGWPAEPKFIPKRTIKLARLKHDANCDPEPLAYERFARVLGKETDTKLIVIGPLPIEKLSSSGVQIATITGTGRLTLGDSQKQALKAFVDKGGTLVIDAAGGSKDFADSVVGIIEELYGARALRRIATSSPLYQLKGMEIDRVKYRRRTRKRLASKDPNLRAYMLDNRPAVIFSREDITAGLAGYPAFTCDGYDVESAYRIMRNIVLFATSRSSGS